MRRKIQKLQAEVAGFVAQRENFVLLARCSDADSSIVLKIVDGLDESSPSELYWSVVDDFRDAESYAEACVTIFAAKHTAAKIMLEKEGKAALAPLPDNVAKPGLLPPVERVRQLMIFSRSLLPYLTGCAVIWNFLPMAIADPQGWRLFADALRQLEMPFPWCHHMRMILRDTFPQNLLTIQDAAKERATAMEVDFSPPAIRKALEEESDDESTPLEERVNNTVILAGMDYSHGDYDKAFRQYDIAHRYAAATGNFVLAAVSLNGLGETRHAQGDKVEAGKMFEAGIAPAAQAPTPPVPVLFSLYFNLGTLRYEEEKWEEAEVYLSGAAEFAKILRDPMQRLNCWKLTGDAQAKQKKDDDAVATWTKGAIVAGKLDRTEDHDEFVDRLRSHYQAQGKQDDFHKTVRTIKDGIAAPDEEPAPAPAGKPSPEKNDGPA